MENYDLCVHTQCGKESDEGGCHGNVDNMKLVLPLQVDEQKEDFSDLPPTQRKRKLQQKIDLIKKDLAKEQAERWVPCLLAGREVDTVSATRKRGGHSVC